MDPNLLWSTDGEEELMEMVEWKPTRRCTIDDSLLTWDDLMLPSQRTCLALYETDFQKLVASGKANPNASGKASLQRRIEAGWWCWMVLPFLVVRRNSQCPPPL